MHISQEEKDYFDDIRILYNNNSDNFISNYKKIDLTDEYSAFEENLEWNSILDLWCWFWVDLRRFVSKGYECNWIDICDNFVEYCNDIPELKWKVAQWNIIDFDKIYKWIRFNWIRSKASIVHMTKYYWLVTIEKVFKNLRIWWVFFLSVKKYIDWDETVFKESTSTPWTIKKYVYYKEDELLNYCKNMWFKIVYQKSNPSDNWRDIWLNVVLKK